MTCSKALTITCHASSGVCLLGDGIHLASSGLTSLDVCVLDINRGGAEVVQRLRGHSGSITTMAATTNMCLVTASDDAVAKSWGIVGEGVVVEEQEDPTAGCRHGKEVTAMAISSHLPYFYTLGTESDTSTGEVFRKWSENGPPLADVALPALNHVLSELAGTVELICLLPGDRMAIFTSTEALIVCCSNVTTPVVILKMPSRSSKLVNAQVLDFAGKAIMAVASTQKIFNFSLRGDLLSTQDAGGTISAMAVSSDGKMVAAAVNSRRLLLWNKAGRQTTELAIETEGIVNHVLPISGRIIILTANAKLQRVDTKEKSIATSGCIGSGAPLECAVLSADGRFVIARAESTVIHIVRVSDLIPVMTYTVDVATMHLGVTRAGNLVVGCGRPFGMIGIATFVGHTEDSPGPAWFTKLAPHERKVHDMTHKKHQVRHISDNHTQAEYDVAFREAAWNGRTDLLQSLADMGANVDTPDAVRSWPVLDCRVIAGHCVPRPLAVCRQLHVVSQQTHRFPTRVTTDSASISASLQEWEMSALLLGECSHLDLMPLDPLCERLFLHFV